ncbi:hypothetical protein MMC31_004611 [Peltigera leucophlebia]|nr:hypothetical protein [Peltigera leucophlebia]
MDGILYQDLLLHNVPQQIVEGDILVFLTSQIKMLQENYKISEDWPGLQNINIIAWRAHGLFIYAATVCRFIDDPDDPDPGERLDLVPQEATENQLCTKVLDEIYKQVLHNSIRKIDEADKQKLSREFQVCGGSIVNLSDVLSIPDLAQLLAISPSKVKRLLHSILNISADQTAPVKLLHPSFRDFLLDRCHGFSPDLGHARFEIYTIVRSA